MPTVGWVSRKCDACRKGHIKCDLVRPDCGQCLRKGLLCVGYSDGMTARLRIETLSSFAAALRRKGHKRKGNEHIVSSTIEKDQKQRTLDDSVANEYQDEASRIYALRLPRSLSESWDARFVPFFLACVQPAHNISRDIFSIIFRVVARANISSAVYHACNAVASSFLARTSRSINTISQHIREYGTALAKLRTALKDPVDVKSDNTLLTIWFLSLYEFIQTGQDGICPSALLSHNRIIKHLIKLRGPEQFLRQDARDLFLATLSKMEMQTYMLGEEWEEAPIWFDHFKKYCDASEYARFRTCAFCHQCSQLCGRIQYLLKRNQPDEILANVPSILQGVEAGKILLCPFCDLETTINCQLISRTCLSQFHHRYCGGALVLQIVFRMRALYHQLTFLQRASHLLLNLKNKEGSYKDIQSCCIQEMYALANRILFLTSDRISLPLAHEGSTSLDHPATEGVMPQTARFEIDFDNLPAGNSTLVVKFQYSGIVVTLLTFH